MVALMSMLDLFIFTMVSLVNFVNSHPASNPAYLDLFKLLIGSITWIGGLVGYMYWREKNLKAAVVNK